MFRIISSFLKACDEDVLKLMCGKTRVGAVEGAKHLQGLTIDLSQKPDSVSPACRKKMETIAEMQADARCWGSAWPRSSRSGAK